MASQLPAAMLTVPFLDQKPAVGYWLSEAIQRLSIALSGTTGLMKTVVEFHVMSPALRSSTALSVATHLMVVVRFPVQMIVTQ